MDYLDANGSVLGSVVDPEGFFSNPDPFQLFPDPDPVWDPK